MLYGGSNTGKTTILKEIAYMLKDHIPQTICYSTTNAQNGEFDDMLPPVLIKDQVTRKALINLYRSQDYKTTLFKIVNNSKYLEPIFNDMKSQANASHAYYAGIRTVEDYNRQYQTFKNALATNIKESKLAKEEALKRAEATKNKHIAEVYRSAIRQHRVELSAYYGKSQCEEKKVIVDFLDINPKLLVILDDCMEALNAISKKSSDKSKNDDEGLDDITSLLFTQGRHKYITIIAIAQDDNKISTTMRKGAFISIFTDMECCNHFFDSKANAFSKAKKAKAQAIANKIFEDPSEYNYKKFVYFRNGVAHNTFSYTIANVYPKFRLCCDEVWQFCDYVNRKKPDQTTKFLQTVRKKIENTRYF